MNLVELERKLIAAARSHPPGEQVPYAFAKRIAAHLGSRRPLDASTLWARALWRAAAPCVGIMLLLGAVSWFMPAHTAPATDLAQEFDNTVLAAAEPQDQATDQIW